MTIKWQSAVMVSSLIASRPAPATADDLSLNESDLHHSVRNLLENCAAMSPGQSLLVLAEDPRHGMYGAGLGDRVAAAARAMGFTVELRQVPFTAEQPEPQPDLFEAMRRHDRTLFLSRLGDQIRFNDIVADLRPIVCYALDAEMLASPFGQADHRALQALKGLVNRALARAREIRVTCPLGTDFSGSGVGFPAGGGDTSVERFPLSVFTPAPAAGFSGRVAQAGFLVGTGSNYYQPYGIGLDDTLFVTFDGNRITGFDGRPVDVAAARAHYRFVAERFDIDPWFVHSWHAGIHPGCAYRQPSGNSLERWSGGAFGNPRLLHFHTCGGYPPGEISLNVVDPTIRIDGIAVWDAGWLHPERLEGGAELLRLYPSLRRICQAPARDIGLGPAGRLSI